MRLFIVGYYGSGNLGDELIIEATSHALRRRLGPNLTLCATRFRPGHELPDDVEGVDIHNALGVLNTVYESDAVILGGGGLLQDKRTPSISDVLTSPSWSLAAYCRPILFAQLLERPTFVLGTGVGPLESELGQFLTRRVLDGSRGTWLRDPDSSALAASIAPEACGETRADLAWAHPNLTRLDDDKKTPRDCCLLNLRAASTMPDVDIGAIVRTTLNFARSQGLQPLFVPFHYGTALADDQLGMDLSSAYPDLDLQAQPTHITEHTQLWRRAAVSVGARFHSAVIAAAHGVPHIALPYDAKVTSLMNDLECSDLVTTGDAAELGQLLDRAWRDREEIASLLRRTSGALSAKAEASLDELAAAVSELPGTCAPRAADDLALERARALATMFERHDHRDAMDVIRRLEMENQNLRNKAERIERSLASLERSMGSTPAGRLYKLQSRVGRWVRRKLEP